MKASGNGVAKTVNGGLSVVFLTNARSANRDFSVTVACRQKNMDAASDFGTEQKGERMGERRPCRHPKKMRIRQVDKEGKTIEVCGKCGANRTGWRRWYWSRFRDPLVKIVK